MPRHAIRWLVILGVALGLLASAAFIALQIVLPVFRFPAPGGPYAIGTVTYHWVDASRAELLSADPHARRELMAQISYPAKPNPAAPRAPYVQDADALAQALAGWKHWPRAVFGQLSYVTTNAVASAQVSDGKPNYPVLIFLEGAMGFRQMSSFQVEALVSRGYIVVAIDQPFTAATTVFPDGRQVNGLPIEQMMPLIHQSYSPAGIVPSVNGRSFANGIVAYLAQDVSFVVNQLAAMNQADPKATLSGRFNMGQVGAFGMSLGGIVAAEACRVDARLHACLLMDAPMPADVVMQGLPQAVMWITRDIDTMRLERRRSGGWSEDAIREHQTTMRATFVKPGGNRYFVQVPGMFHVNLTDVPLWSPLLPWLGVTGPMDGQRAHAIINAYSLAFFGQHLLGQPQVLLDGPVSQYPEVLFEARQAKGR